MRKKLWRAANLGGLHKMEGKIIAKGEAVAHPVYDNQDRIDKCLNCQKPANKCKGDCGNENE